MAASNYFSHDSNARSDERIISLRIKHGWAGYGLYWALIEKLRDSMCYNLGTNYDVLAYDLRCDTAMIKSVVNDFGLFAFTEDGGCFYSESLNNRMKPLEERKLSNAKAGKLSAEKRKKSIDRSTDVQQMFNRCSTDVQPIKGDKIREENIKEKEKEKERETFPSFSEEVISPPDLSIFEKPLSECEAILSSSRSWAEVVTMNTRKSGYADDFTLECFQKWLKLFFLGLQSGGAVKKSPKDAMQHFASWLKIELKKEKDGKGKFKSKQSADNQPVRTTQKDYTGTF